MRRFCVFKRGKYFYGQIWNPELQKYTTARSTGKQRKRDAEAVVQLWFQQGIPIGDERRELKDGLDVHTLLNLVKTTELTHKDVVKILAMLDQRKLLPNSSSEESDEVFLDFLRRFWTYNESPYVKEKLAYGHRIGKRHCYDMNNHVENHWSSFFEKNKLLREVVRADLREFSSYLAGKNLSWKTRNNILLSGTVALNWVFENQLLQVNPALGLKKFSGETSQRGILTDEETNKLFCRKWNDPRAKIGNMLAATTGLRVGEIVALQVKDIDADNDLLHIRHSWSEKDRLKAPKTNRTRTVPLLPKLKNALLVLAMKNPHGCQPESFIFWSTVRNDTPCDRKLFTDHLRKQLQEMKIDSKRNIVFHSWRHYYASKMANHLDKRKVMLATGHRDGAVFDVYANHENAEVLKIVQTTTKEIFHSIIAPEVQIDSSLTNTQQMIS